MPNCIRCGEKISDEQLKNFSQKCSECVRAEKNMQKVLAVIFLWIGISSSLSGVATLAMGIVEFMAEEPVVLFGVTMFVLTLFLFIAGGIFTYFGRKLFITA